MLSLVLSGSITASNLSSLPGPKSLPSSLNSSDITKVSFFPSLRRIFDVCNVWRSIILFLYDGGIGSGERLMFPQSNAAKCPFSRCSLTTLPSSMVSSLFSLSALSYLSHAPVLSFSHALILSCSALTYPIYSHSLSISPHTYCTYGTDTAAHI